MATANRGGHVKLTWNDQHLKEWIQWAIEDGGEVVDPEATRVHKKLDDAWRIAPENVDFREKVQETVLGEDGRVKNQWVPRRPIPKTDVWFETAWARFRSGDGYNG